MLKVNDTLWEDRYVNKTRNDAAARTSQPGPGEQAAADARSGAQDFASAMDENIGRNLKMVRERRGISQSELARQVSEIGLVGIHQTTIARIESGKRSLRAAEALAFSRVLEVSIEVLAETAATASLRDAHLRVEQAVQTFVKALDDLISARTSLALLMDSMFPLGPDGVPSASGVAAKLDPGLYEWIDETLHANSAPDIYLHSAYYARVRDDDSIGRPLKGRMGELHDWYASWVRSYEDAADNGVATDNLR